MEVGVGDALAGHGRMIYYFDHAGSMSGKEPVVKAVTDVTTRGMSGWVATASS